MANESARAAAQRQLTLFGLVLAIAGVVGLVTKPHLAYIWAFMIVFGLIKVPEQLYRWWRRRRT